MGFRIDGSDYEIPEFDSFTMGEAMILYDHSKLSLEDFALDEDDPKQAEALRKNILNPGTVLSRMIVAYLRGNPGTSRDAAEAIVEGSNWLETYLSYTERFKGDAGPPESRSDEDAESSASSPAPSGESSTPSSGGPDATPEPTGTSA